MNIPVLLFSGHYQQRQLLVEKRSEIILSIIH